MPRSFLVKKTLLAKRRLSQDADHDKESLESSVHEDHISTAFIPRAIATANGSFASSHTYPVVHTNPPSYSSSFTGFQHHNLDTHGLHTLADLCLRSADYNQPLQITTHTSSKVHSYKSEQVKTEKYSSRREHDLSPVASEGDVEDKEGQEGSKPIDVVGDSDERKQVASQGSGINSARLERLDDELEKMLQGSDEIISREVREFLDNNRPSQKEAARVSTLSQSEITRFLNQGLDVNEEKKTRFYRWYLEKKLGAMDPDDESFTCYKCGKIFAYQNYLERHVKYVCPDKTGRTWKCSYCSKAFQYPCYLRRHMRSHTGESPYKCTQCSRAFVRSTDLQRHLRNHTGEKPYKCKECSRAFARSTDLKRHMRTHTGEKPYKCWQCSKAFSQSGSLQTHLHTHYKESLQIKGVLPESGKAHKT